jgi:hypothetical protein
MQAVAWCMWEPGFLLDREGDRLEPNPAYYAVAQFTRFARPGMVLVEASDAAARTTCYLDREARRLVLITVNDSRDPLPLRYDLSGFAGLGSIERRRTSAAECLATLPPLPCTDGFLDTLPPQSVTTFVTSYTAIRKPLLGNGGFETGTLGPWHGEPAELTGVQDTYPQGGSYDGFIDLTPNAAGALSQQVTGLRPGARHALTAACATSGIEATLSVTGVGLEAKAGASGGTYRHARVEFTAPADGAVTVAYSARWGDEKGSWATIDNVRLSPLAE